VRSPKATQRPIRPKHWSLVAIAPLTQADRMIHTTFSLQTQLILVPCFFITRAFPLRCPLRYHLPDRPQASTSLVVFRQGAVVVFSLSAIAGITVQKGYLYTRRLGLQSSHTLLPPFSDLPSTLPHDDKSRFILRPVRPVSF
jgi:hypothetical protein